MAENTNTQEDASDTRRQCRHTQVKHQLQTSGQAQERGLAVLHVHSTVVSLESGSKSLLQSHSSHPTDCNPCTSQPRDTHHYLDGFPVTGRKVAMNATLTLPSRTTGLLKNDMMKLSGGTSGTSRMTKASCGCEGQMPSTLEVLLVARRTGQSLLNRLRPAP